MDELKRFKCAACKREFEATEFDVELVGGHLCIALDQGISQHEAIRQFSENIGATA